MLPLALPYQAHAMGLSHGPHPQRAGEEGVDLLSNGPREGRGDGVEVAATKRGALLICIYIYTI